MAASTNAQSVFPDLDTNFRAKTILVAGAPIEAKPIFVGGKDTVLNKEGKYALAKQWHDFITYTPINSAAPNDSGYVLVNHELQEKNNLLGDGGGMTVFKVRKKQDGSWEKYGPFRNVDFSEVGNTLANCGGITAPNGRIWTAEEWMVANNKSLATGLSDTSDFTIPAGSAFAGTTIKKYQNFNWMVEVDPAQAKAIRKMYNWGRFGHEGGVVMPDLKTVYLTDDYNQAAFYKFVADTENDYSSGKLFAYQQSADGESGTWILLDNSKLENVSNIQSYALEQGATMFLRHEWAVDIDGKVYITETGADSSNYKSYLKKGYKLAKHLIGLDTIKHPFTLQNPKDSAVKDPYGRVLVFDPLTDKMSVFIEGGKAKNYSSNKVHLSNPDGIGKVSVNGKTFLVIEEDLNGTTFGRVGNANVSSSGRKTIAEIYLLDMSVTDPTLDDLKRFAITPLGTEVTGITSSPDGSVLFFNSQHPDTSNTGDYKNSLTMMVTNLEDVITSIYENPSFEPEAGFQIWPNPAFKELRFNMTTDVAIYNAKGEKVRVERNTNVIDISELSKGSYWVQTIEGQVQKLIVE